MAKTKRKRLGKTRKPPKSVKRRPAPVRDGPPVPTDVRALVNPWSPQFPREGQLALLAKYPPAEVYTVGVDGQNHETFAASARAGSAMWVAETCLLAERRGGKATMVASMLRWMNEIHANGGFVWEGSTGLRSDRPAWRKAMIERAKDALRRIAQGAKSAINAKRGAAAHDFTKAEMQIIIAVKYDRRYPNWPARYKAMKAAGIKEPPGRTWFIDSADAYAQSVGVTI